MRLAIRPMLDTEMPLVRDTWTRSIDANEAKDQRGRDRVINGRVRNINGHACPWLKVGGEFMVVDWAWYEMHRAWVKAKWDELTILVATLPGHDELIGWCAMTPPGEHPLVVHYVFVLDLPTSRGKGIARQLLRAAAAHADSRQPRFSFMRGRVDSTGVLDKRLANVVHEAWREVRNANRAAQMRGGAPMH